MSKYKVRIVIRAVMVLTCVALTVHAGDWVEVPDGQFMMGDVNGDANETPVQKRVSPFQIMRFEVSNDQFSSFVEDSGYVTDVERNKQGYVWDTRWSNDPDATFRQPHGQHSGIENTGNHPVVQVSARDAQAYCAHYGWRLPTEIEWEFAARGTDGRRYPWGNQSPKQHRSSALANFGTVACCAPSTIDGHAMTSPVGSYPKGASPFGVLDMAGNVWEWTSTPFPGRAQENVIRGGGWGNNPYCLRASYRHGNPPDIGLNMVGFRCAR